MKGKVELLLLLCFVVSCSFALGQKNFRTKTNCILIKERLAQQDFMIVEELSHVDKKIKLITGSNLYNNKQISSEVKFNKSTKDSQIFFSLVSNFSIKNNSFKIFINKLQIYKKIKNFYEKSNFEKVLLKIISQELSPSDLMIVLGLKEYSILVGGAAIALTKEYFKQNKLDDAENLLRKYWWNFSTVKFKQEANNLLNEIKISKQVDLKAVGVVLPLSGKYASYGARVLSAIQLALGLPQYLNHTSPIFIQEATGIKLIIANSKGSSVQAIQVVDELVRVYNVVVILGDIIAESSLSVAKSAQKFAVPVIVLSRVSKITDLGPFVLRLGLTLEKQARALAKYAVNNLWINRFGILYPRHKYGVEMMKYFWDEVEKQGAEIRAVESYDYQQTTFTIPIKKMIGTYYIDARSEYLLCKQKANELKNLKKQRMAVKICKNKLSPVVDFEALFIPDFDKTISYIIPALISEDILVSQNHYVKKVFTSVTRREETPLQLLGGSGWNNPVLGERIGKQLDGALFVDGFNSSSIKFKNSRFVNEFLGLHNFFPSLIEVQAHDAALAVKKILFNNMIHIKNRRDFLDQILSQGAFYGLTGLFQFGSDGESTSSLHWFTFNNGKIKTISNY